MLNLYQMMLPVLAAEHVNLCSHPALPKQEEKKVPRHLWPGPARGHQLISKSWQHLITFVSQSWIQPGSVGKVNNPEAQTNKRVRGGQALGMDGHLPVSESERSSWEVLRLFMLLSVTWVKKLTRHHRGFLWCFHWIKGRLNLSLIYYICAHN